MCIISVGSTQYLGANLDDRDSPQGQDGQRVVLAPGVGTLGRGVVLKFYAYFVLTETVWLQVWRPNGGMSYRLVGQHRHVPEAVPRRAVVSTNITSYNW